MNDVKYIGRDVHWTLFNGVVRKTNLAGEPLALVGPRRASYALRRSSTGTGSGSHVEWVRAS